MSTCTATVMSTEIPLKKNRNLGGDLGSTWAAICLDYYFVVVSAQDKKEPPLKNAILEIILKGG